MTDVVFFLLSVLAMAYPNSWEPTYIVDKETVRVIDGDTFEADIEIWPQVTVNAVVRINGIDAPELSRPSKECYDHEKSLGEAAKTYLEAYIAQAKFLYVSKPKNGKYAGRVVADVYATINDNTLSLANLMIYHRLAIPYDGGKRNRDHWCGVKLDEGL